MNFSQKLEAIIAKNNSLLCVGLDSDITKLPQAFSQEEYPQFAFNKEIITATADIVCSFKPNTAFYEARGDRGVLELKMTCDFINTNYPDIPIILDAKRGDIGNTNDGYTQYAFDYLGADGLTVMPYMGIETLSSFFAKRDKGIFVGCHSSNPGAKEFQELPVIASEGKQSLLYQVVAKELIKQHGTNPNCCIFMGATYPAQMKDIRNIVGDMTMLVPGIGTQEANVEDAVKAGLNSKKMGMIINSSRGILFASNGTDFAQRAKEEAEKLQKEINKYR